MKIDWYNSQLTKKSADVRGQWMYGALKKNEYMGTISTRWCNLLPKFTWVLEQWRSSSNGTCHGNKTNGTVETSAVTWHSAAVINMWKMTNTWREKTTNDCPPLPDFNVMTSSSRPAHVVSNTICYSLERVLNPWRKYPNKSMGNSPSHQ